MNELIKKFFRRAWSSLKLRVPMSLSSSENRGNKKGVNLPYRPKLSPAGLSGPVHSQVFKYDDDDYRDDCPVVNQQSDVVAA